MGGEKQTHDGPEAEQGSEQSDKDAPYQRHQHGDEDSEQALNEKQRPDSHDVAVAVRPKVQVNGRRGHDKGRAGNKESARRGYCRPPPGSEDSAGANTTFNAHIGPHASAGSDISVYFTRSHLHR